MKNALKLASTLNIALALIAYTLSNAIVYPIILVILSIIYLILSEKTNAYLYNKKTTIILLSLTNLILNPITGITLLIGKDKITPEIEQEKPKEKKSLLNLGVGLIGISGIILATTNWYHISSTTKMIILTLTAIIFITLSVIIEKKLALKKLAKNYWLLGMLFIMLAIITTGFHNIISDWFSYKGEGQYLYLSLTTISLALLSLITNKKYPHHIYNTICYISITSSIIFILLQLKLAIEIILLSLNILLLIINIIKPIKIKEISKYTTYALSLLTIPILITKEPTISAQLLSLTTIINTLLITIKGTSSEGIVGTLIIHALTIQTIANININDNFIVNIISIIIYSLYYLLNLTKIENKTFKIFMNILTNFIMFIILISSNKTETVILATIILITSIINYYKKTINSEKILLPIKIIILTISLIRLVQEIFILNTSYILIILYIIAFTIYKIIKNKNIKSISLITYYIIYALALLNENKEIIPSIINLVTSITTLYIITKEQNNTKIKIAHITMLLTILLTFTYTNILETNIINNSLIVLLLYILIFIFTHKNQTINKINLLAIMLPLITINFDITTPYEIQKIIESTISIYIVILISKFLLKKDQDKNILLTIMTSAIILRIIFIQSWIIGLYIGIIALTLIIIGFIKKEYKTLYIEGIIITIINLIYQIKFILNKLPLWLYIFLSGLIIIGLVTYKEIKNTKKGT